MTNVTIIFSRFLQKLSDYKLLVNPSDKEAIQHLEDTMNDYLTTARAKFYHCPKDLSLNRDNILKITDNSGEEKEVHYRDLDTLDLDEDTLNKHKELKIMADLNDMEIHILSMLMLVEYFKQIMIRNETLEQAVGDSDFNIYSQANHINQLKDLYKELKREVNTEIGRYTYIGRIYAKESKGIF